MNTNGVSRARLSMRICLVAGFVFTLNGCALFGKKNADEQVAEAPEKKAHPCEVESGDQDMIHDTQVMLHEMTCRASYWLDGRAGVPADADAAKQAHGYVETTVNVSEYAGVKSRTRARVRIDLPNIEKRLSAFFDIDDQGDAIRGRDETFALRTEFPRVDDRSGWLAGLGYSLPGTEKLKINFKVGATSLSHPRAFVKSNIGYLIYSDEDELIYTTATPFYSTRERFGVTISGDYNRVMGPDVLLRITNTGTRSEVSDGLDWYSALITYINLGQERGLAWQLFTRGRTAAPVPILDYGVRVVMRHPLVKNVLYGETLIGYNFPREQLNETREGSAVIGYGLTMPFGEQN